MKFVDIKFKISVTTAQKTLSFHYRACLVNLLNAELNLICHLLALLGAHHIFHVSGVRVNVAWGNNICLF